MGDVVTGGHPELRDGPDGAVLTVHVQPGARRSELVGRHGDALKLKVAAPPIEGRANDAVVALIAELFGLRRSEVTLIAGATSRRKQLVLIGVRSTDAAVTVDRLLAG